MSANARATSSARAPEAGRADAGRVDGHADALEDDELPVGGGVAAGAAALHLAGGEQLRAGQAIDQRRLAGSRLAEEHEGAAGDQGHEVVDAVAGARADGEHGNARCHRFDVEDGAAQVVVTVGLGEHERHLRPARVGERDELLHAAGPDGHVERPHDEHDVDVGGHDAGLLRHRGAGVVAGVAHQRGAAFEAGPDGRAVQGDPVADGQVVGGQADARRRQPWQR